MNSSYYKHCIVPGCKSTSIKTPEKLFIHVPYGQKVRKQWLKLVRQDDAHCLSTKSRMYFCEDHFDMLKIPEMKAVCIEDRLKLVQSRHDGDTLPNDMVNYMQYHLMGSVAQVRMKPGCVPSKFDCQAECKRKGLELPRAKSKRKRVGERHNDMVEIEIDIGDNSSSSSEYKVINPNDKACQTKRSTKLSKDTTFICNRYIYGDRCDVQIQVDIARKMPPKRTTSTGIQLPKIICEDKFTETENKYFVISTTKYKPLVKESSESARIESEAETENEELGENSRIESENEEFTESSIIKIELETEYEEFTEISKVKSESETKNEEFSNISKIKSEPDPKNEQCPKTSIAENEHTIENEQSTEKKEQFSKNSKLKSGEETANELFIEISSIKSEPVDEVS